MHSNLQGHIATVIVVSIFIYKNSLNIVTEILKKDNYCQFILISGPFHLLTLPDFVCCLHLGLIIDLILILVLNNTIQYLKSVFSLEKNFHSLQVCCILVFNFIRPHVMQDSRADGRGGV